MASLSTDKAGNRLIQFQRDGGRGTIRLGKVSLAIARKVKGHIEELISSKRMRQSVEPRTAAWVASLDDDDLLARLAAVGLVEPREAQPTATLGVFLATYMAHRIDVKPATKLVWEQAVRNLVDHFGTDRPLDSIHEGDADGFKLYLMGQKLSTVTVFKRLQICRMFFRAAMRQKLTAGNPFAEVSAKAVPRHERYRYVTREETERIIAVCNPMWRTIVALARYGGLRCPSEVLSVKWTDVNWEASRLVVTAPKTAHHPGKGERVIPLFPELRAILEEADELAEPGAEYIIDPKYREKAMTPRGWANCNLRTQFQRILRRAGVAGWPRLFHALRSSRETELAKEYPLHVVTAWLGNTPKIAMKHYLMVTDDDYQRAAKSAAALHCKESHDIESVDKAESDEAEFSGVCASVRHSAQMSGGDDRI